MLVKQNVIEVKKNFLFENIKFYDDFFLKFQVNEKLVKCYRSEKKSFV